MRSDPAASTVAAYDDPMALNGFARAVDVITFEFENVPLDTVPVDEQFSSPQLAIDLRARGVQALSLADTDAILAHLSATCRPGDVVAILSNGGFDGIHDRLLAQFGQAA